MKKILFAALIAGTSLFSVAAHADGAYAGFALEKTNYSIDVIGATTTSKSDKPTGFKIYGGWEYNQNLAIEAGYADFGAAKNSFTTGATTGTVEAKVSSFYVAGKGTLPINEQFSAYGKLGVARNKSDISGTGGGAAINYSSSKTGMYAGLGLAYNLNKNAAVTVEYENFGKLDNAGSKANVFSIGARFNF